MNNPIRLMRPRAVVLQFSRLLMLVCVLIFSQVVHATHIVGGELTYQYKSGNTYEIRLDLYIDCENGNAQAIAQDATAYISFFDAKTGTYLESLTNLFNSGFTSVIGDGVPRNGPNRLQKLNYNCIKNTPNACVDHYWYTRQVNLASRPGGYIISFQRCCRNNTISNLVRPDITGATYWTYIPDPSETPNSKPNSNAVFKERPPNFLCTNAPLRFDHSAIDADGDSLVYELFHPYDGADQLDPRPDNNGNGNFESPPFRQINWASGYSETDPINGSPKLAINSKTGLLTITPTKVGQFVIGIKVLEYRKGVLISESKRDYQFNVQSCVVDVVASYYNPQYICGYTYQFDNQSSGAQRYHWDFGVPGKTDDTSNQFEPVYTFPGPGTYNVSLKAYKDKCVDSFTQTVEAVTPPKPVLRPDTLVCKGISVNLSVSVPGYSNKWSTGQTGNSISVNKNGLYWVESTLKTCKGRDSFYLSVDSAKVQLPADTIICSNSPLNEVLQSKGTFASYKWSTGAITPSITVTSAGIYSLSAKTSNGCLTTDSMKIEKYPELRVVLRDTQVCRGTVVTFDAGNPGSSFVWSNNATTQSISVDIPGIYSVSVTRGVCKTKEEVLLTNWPDEMLPLQDLYFCDKLDTLVSLAGRGYKSVTWNENTGETYRITVPGWIKVHILNSKGCRENDSFKVTLYPRPNLNLISDTTVCLSVNPVLFAGFGMQSYLWNDGSRGNSLTAIEKGLYWVEVKDRNGCRSRDSVMINKQGDLFPSVVYMPNAFTPDGNGLNDLYPNNKYINIGTLYNVKLYNRWGQKMAEFNSPDLNWDGTYGGKEAPAGVYVYLVSWIGCDNQRKTLRGDFTLIR